MAKKQIPLHVQQIKSNLKSIDGEAWHVDLGDKTLIVGPNGSHKSAIAQSLELAVSGAADDIVGRTAVKSGDTLLSTAHEDALWIQANLSNGEISSFKVQREDEKVKRPAHVSNSTAVLPLRDVKAALAGSTSTAMRAFFTWACADISEDAFIVESSPAVNITSSQDVQEALDAYEIYSRHRKDSPAARLLSLHQYTGEQVRSRSGKIKALEARTVVLQHTLFDSCPSDEDIDGAKQQLVRAASANSAPTQEIEAAEDAVRLWTERVRSLDASLVSDSMANCANSILTTATFEHLQSCPICASPVGLEHLRACQSHYSGQADAETEAISGDIETANENLVAWKTHLEKLRSQSAPVDSSSVIRAANELTDMVANRKQWDEFSQCREDVNALEVEVDSFGRAKKGVEVIIKDVLAQHTMSFVESVNRFLPKGYVFDMTVHPKLSVGLVRNGALHTALSGAEWVTVTAAIAMVASSSMDAELRVIVLEDRALDPDTLRGLLKTFSAFNGQVVITSVTKPKGRPFKAWKVIDLYKAPLCDAPIISAAPEPDAAPEPEAEPEAELPPAPPTEPVVVKRRKRSAIKAPSSRKILKGLGYTDADLDVMTPDTAVSIIKEGLLAKDVDTHSDGTVTVILRPNVHQLPRLQ